MKGKMRIVAVQNSDLQERVDHVLKSTRLTSRDLLSIAEISENVHAVAHISSENSQILVGVPERFHPLLWESSRISAIAEFVHHPFPSA
jgi:hypothetical protein